MHICTECGRVCEEDYDFCPTCGSTKGTNVDRTLIPEEFKIVNSPQGKFLIREDFRKLRLGLMLALFPGIFNIFGLGHLFTKQLLKGFFFLGMSVLYYYERIFHYLNLSDIALFVITIVVFIVQCFDMMGYVRRKIAK